MLNSVGGMFDLCKQKRVDGKLAPSMVIFTDVKPIEVTLS